LQTLHGWLDQSSGGEMDTTLNNQIAVRVSGITIENASKSHYGKKEDVTKGFMARMKK
jgi:hypothetical protein